MVDYWTNRIQKYLKRYVIILIMIICSHASAQYQQLFFDRISIEEGLSNSSVHYILQDKRGFMWFATYNGLNRYDGFSFKVYTNDINDSTTISSNFLYNLYEDSEGFIWVVNGRSTGLDRYDPSSEKFEHFINNPNDPSSISSNEIFSVTEDSKGDIWIITADHLNRYLKQDDGKAKFERFAKPQSAERLNYVFENKHKELCIFSDSLYYFDIANRRFINAGVDLFGNPALRSLVELDNGDLLLGTFVGILKLEYQGIGKGYKLVDPGKLNVAPGTRTCLYLDHKKHLWIGTEFYGLYRYRFDTDV